MDVLGVIPARFHSTRLAGKPLADIWGKPMIQHVWERARQARLLKDLIIACDDDRIVDAARKFNAKVVLTDRNHPSGTDRICEVVNKMDVRIVINVQGDEPLIHPSMIDSVAKALLDDPKVTMATLRKKITDPGEIDDPHVVKVVVDNDDFALYFSRAAIPYHSSHSEVKSCDYYKHIGLYGYTKDFLFTFKNLPASDLEKTERLEQLRVLQGGFRIKAIETPYDTVSVDTPQDLERVKRFLKEGKNEDNG